MAKHIHKNLIAAVEGNLHSIFIEGKYADRVIETSLKQNPKWGARDRKFIAETTYDMVRWWRLITECGEIEQGDPGKFLKAIRTWHILQEKESFPVKDHIISEEKILRNRKSLDSVPAIRESIPDWLEELGTTELNNPWAVELHALNEHARVVLRTNTLKVSQNILLENLKESGIEAERVPFLPDALMLIRRTNIFQNAAFKQGWFELQDASSQEVAPFLRAEPGMRVIDACAGAGGKTLHLASLMKNKGRIIALDVDQRKLQELHRRARRAGAGMIETRLIESNKTVKRLESSADRVLLDVPCSGLGVLRRNPDAKWKLSPEFIEGLKAIQHGILDRYSKMVKPGGKLVYATCSILPSENEQQVKLFLNNHHEFILEDQKQILPSSGFDGFYMARMIRKPA